MADTLIDFNELIQALLDLSRDIEENYKEHLASSGRYTTEYNLIDSVKTNLNVSGMNYEVTMDLKKYWKYVEYDTKPHFPPPQDILNWIQIKPIAPRPFDNGNIPTEKQLAYLIGRKISQEGTKGSHDLEKTKDAIIPFYKERLSKALGHDVENYIRKVVKDEIIKGGK